MTQPEVNHEPQSPSRSTFWVASWWKAVLVIAAGLFIGLGALAAINLLARPLAILIIAASIAAALSPLVNGLARHIPRGLAVVALYLGVVLVLAIIGAATVPSLIRQFDEFSDQVPAMVDRIETLVDQAGLSNSLIETLVSGIGQIGQRLLAVPVTVVSFVFDAVLVVILSLYLLLEAPQIRQFFLSLFSGSRRARAEQVSSSMMQAAGGFVRGTGINMVVVGLVTAGGLTLIGVPFALVLGFISGLFEVIPILGPWLSGIFILLAALLESPTTALIAAVFVIILQQLEGNILVPVVMRGQAKISSAMALLAILAGGVVGGVLGALVAVPVAAMLRVFVAQVIAPFIRRQTGASDSAVQTEEAGATGGGN